MSGVVMASYHINISVGAKGAALEHAQYIGREGRFGEERYGEVEARGHGNMPAWARENISEFWRASDEYERANGNTYREYELALPRELVPAARVALVERFVEQELGTSRPYQWAIHNGTASDGREQPHVHLMFSDRQQDGIERGPEQFFKRYNAKNPERGGARKFSYGADKAEAALAYEGIRERWAKVQNLALEHAGSLARVDHRSLADQGITREPEVHRGPAVSGIEARGEVSHVGERQREQMAEREERRQAVLDEARELERAAQVADRVAARERRELAPLAAEAPREDRAELERRIEADRREQLERTRAVARRRSRGRYLSSCRSSPVSSTKPEHSRIDWCSRSSGSATGCASDSGGRVCRRKKSKRARRDFGPSTNGTRRRKQSAPRRSPKGASATRSKRRQTLPANRSSSRRRKRKPRNKNGIEGLVVAVGSGMMIKPSRSIAR